MGRPRTARYDTVYPPLGMRAERAAAYLDMSESSFLRLVELGELPPGVHKRGMVIWDRHELEDAFRAWKEQRKTRPGNDAAAIMGLPDPG